MKDYEREKTKAKERKGKKNIWFDNCRKSI